MNTWMREWKRVVLTGLVVVSVSLTFDMETFGQDLSPPALELTEGVLVLTDGRVFSGKINNLPGGYRVEWQGSYAIVPYGKVDVTAPTLNAAYLALRDRMLKPTAEHHLQLAEWCLTNQLVGQARSEVSKALNLEPLRSEARVLMAKIDDLINLQQEKVKVPTQSEMTIEGFRRAEEKTVSGLNRTTHQNYIRYVQPLLLNKCGNAYCHGQAASNAFLLEPILRGNAGNRSQSEANLERVLKFINRKDAAASPLLLHARGADSKHQKIFQGSRGEIQYQVLTRWVEEVTGRELTPLPVDPQLAEELPLVMQPIQQVSGEGIDDPIRVRNDRPDGFNEREQLDKVRRQIQPDPFDPDIFNRRVHGGTAEDLRQKSKPVLPNNSLQ